MKLFKGRRYPFGVLHEDLNFTSKLFSESDKIDLRPGETFGHAYSAVLSFENRKQMYIPRGFAHGYLTLEDDTLMQWCVDNDFCAEAARAVRYDSDFIWESESWPAGEYIVSEKDRNAEKFPFSIAKDK